MRPATGGPAVAQGVIPGPQGDFSSFDPPDDTREFVVEAGGLVSVPFRIGMWWLERVTYQNAVNFMNDSRHHVGNERAVCTGSFGWRDDHLAWSCTPRPAMALQPLRRRMPRRNPLREAGQAELWGALEPYPETAPDLVKLIHWGADVIVTQKLDHEFLRRSSPILPFSRLAPARKTPAPPELRGRTRDCRLRHPQTARQDAQISLRRKAPSKTSSPSRPASATPREHIRPVSVDPACSCTRWRSARKRAPTRGGLLRGRPQANRVADRQSRLERPHHHQGSAHERVPDHGRPRASTGAPIDRAPPFK
ncbi:MAG: hypothetical protein U1F77_19415 [Kiritimatiellia bacterium]